MATLTREEVRQLSKWDAATNTLRLPSGEMHWTDVKSILEEVVDAQTVSDIEAVIAARCK
jgi:hypothetical protein